jgi:heme exporter protein B
MMREALAIAKKDIKTEFRTKEMIFSMVVFSLMIMVAFAFAFDFFEIPENLINPQDPTRDPLIPLVPPILWITFCFAGMFGLLSSFSKEKDKGSLDGLLLCPTDRTAIYFGKVISNYFLIVIVDISSIIFFTAFFRYDYDGNILPLMFVVLLGTFCFVVAGTMVAGIVVNSQSIRGVMLPILLIPIILLTVLMPSIIATSKVLEGDIWDALPELRFMGSFALIYLACAYLLFNFVVEE